MEQTYTIKQASEKWGFPESRLRKEVREGRLHAHTYRGATKPLLVTESIMNEWWAGMEDSDEK